MDSWNCLRKMACQIYTEMVYNVLPALNNRIAFQSSPHVIMSWAADDHCHKTTKSEKQHMVLASLILSTGNKQKHICCSVFIKANG